jgi:hypothetical protein
VLVPPIAGHILSKKMGGKKVILTLFFILYFYNPCIC